MYVNSATEWITFTCSILILFRYEKRQYSIHIRVLPSIPKTDNVGWYGFLFVLFCFPVTKDDSKKEMQMQGKRKKKKKAKI